MGSIKMDVDAILARKPSVVLVDELAHTNIAGSKHHKRFEDVMELLQARIDIISTMNVQHIESLGPTVLQITRVQIRETVPDWVMQRVDESTGGPYAAGAAGAHVARRYLSGGACRTGACSLLSAGQPVFALREIALRQVTQVADRSLDTYLKGEGAQPPKVWSRESAYALIQHQELNI